MKFICFGDNWGIPILYRYLPPESEVIIVGAEIRPQYYKELRQFADSLDIDFIIQPRRISYNYTVFVEHLKKIAPDFFFVSSYSMLLPIDLLSIPRRSSINIHSGLLPQYRGCNPMQWALLNDEKETGVTIHYMDENFDTGDIIAREKILISEEDTWIDIQKRVGQATEKLLAEEIPRIIAGTNKIIPQNENSAKYWPRRGPEDGRFEWTWRARDIYNLIRALVKPHPGAFYYNKNGDKIILDDFISFDGVKLMQMSQIGRIIE